MAKKKRKNDSTSDQVPAKVRKSNALVSGQYRFNLNEQKLLLLVLSRIKPGHQEFVPYQVPWSEVKAATNGRLNTSQKVHSACESLKNKTVIIREGKKEIGFGFVSGWTIEQGRFVEIRLDPGMKEMLLDLLQSGNFTLYDLECILSLTSVYSIRIYEILKSIEWMKQPVRKTLSDLKFSLDISNNSKTYSDFGSFRRTVLDKAQKDLKAHTDISFTYSTIKEGRRVVAIDFIVRQNKAFQRTVQGRTTADQARQSLKPGDVVMIAGREYEFNGSGIQMKNGAMPLGHLLRMIEQGKAEVKK